MLTRASEPMRRLEYDHATVPNRERRSSARPNRASIRTIRSALLVCSRRGLEETGIQLEGVGSWTLKSSREERGAEPDEGYTVGRVVGDDEDDGDCPDIAIEVVWTAGGLDKLEIYRRLGVREVTGQGFVHARCEPGTHSRKGLLVASS